ncbi:hypothetical protein H4R35_007374, partial [Dimargaris xerosporica]
WKRLTQATIDQLRLVVRPFTGSLGDVTWTFWYAHATSVVDGLLPNLASPVKLAALKTVLDPVICQQVDHARLTTWTQFLAHMDAHYPDTRWSNHYLVGLQGKTLFKGKPIDQAAALAKEAAWHLGGTSFWAIKLVELLLGQFAADLKYAPSDLWDIHALSSAQLESHIQRIVKEVKLGQTRVQIQHDFAATWPTASKPTAKPAPTTEPAPTPAEDNKAKILSQAKLGGQSVQAAADQGAACSLITLAAAQRLGLHINTHRKPSLQPYWGNAALNVVGTAKALLSTSESSHKQWISLVVAKANLDIELLVSKPQLDALHLDLGEVAAEAVTTMPVQPVSQRPVQAPLGLPSSFFAKVDPKADPKFQRADALYPPVDRANVVSRLTDQCPMPTWRAKLVDTLLTGAAALREYSSGCPPPCLLQPITPPFKDDAELLFVSQAPRSIADQAFMDQYVTTRLHYGIDEPGTANANVLVYSIPKPNTDARRVILDDSLGSMVNMRRIGIALPRRSECHK